jgi:glucose-1-phosphate cytidylyltransferase
MKNIDAIILCGGKGERLRPLTHKVPKPLINIKEKPIIKYIIDHLIRSKINRITLAVGYKSDLFEKYLNKIKSNTIKISNAGDVNILDRIKYAAKDITNDFIVLYGDTITNVNIDKLVRQNYENKTPATVCVWQMKSQFGLFKINDNSMIDYYAEKPMLDYWINIGYFYFRNEMKNEMEKSVDYKNFLEKLTKDKLLSAYKHNGLHITVNTIDELNRAENNIDKIYE